MHGAQCCSFGLPGGLLLEFVGPGRIYAGGRQTRGSQGAGWTLEWCCLAPFVCPARERQAFPLRPGLHPSAWAFPHQRCDAVEQATGGHVQHMALTFHVGDFGPILFHITYSYAQAWYGIAGTHRCDILQCGICAACVLSRSLDLQLAGGIILLLTYGRGTRRRQSVGGHAVVSCNFRGLLCGS